MEEPPCSVQGWTLDTITVHLSDKIASLKELFDEHTKSTERAIQKAEIATEKRFEEVNEFRKALSDQTAGQLTRAEYTVQHKALEGLISAIDNRLTRMEVAVSTRHEGLTMTGAIILGCFSAVAVLVGAVDLILRLSK